MAEISKIDSTPIEYDWYDTVDDDGYEKNYFENSNWGNENICSTNEQIVQALKENQKIPPQKEITEKIISVNDGGTKFHEQYMKLLKQREDENNLFDKINNPCISSFALGEAYNKIIECEDKKKSESISYYFEQVHNGDMADQGKFVNVPLGFHIGGMEKFVTIYGEDNEKNIDPKDMHGNWNEKLGTSIEPGSIITFGMNNYAEGIRWANGLIAYNSNCIIVRDADNRSGQPGFMRGCFFYDRLAIMIMDKYIVPKLIRNVNENLYCDRTDPLTVTKWISDQFSSIYTQKSEQIKTIDSEIDKHLFSDAPQREILNKPLDEKDRKIFDLEKQIKKLSDKVDSLTKIVLEYF
jgi:hypothetical protein